MNVSYVPRFQKNLQLRCEGKNEEFFLVLGTKY